MEPLESVELRLSDVCRSCLIKTNEMTSFYPKNEETSEIIAMLSSVGNIEIEINELLPSYLCKTCEEKLRLSYDFQILIQRSNEIIQECLTGSEMIVGLEQQDSFSEDKCNLEVIPEIKVESDTGVTQTVRKATKVLKQISATEVEEAINEYKEKSLVNIECIKCGFVTVNNRSLSVHMSRLHKEVKDYWCCVCNIEVENLAEHTTSHTKNQFRCKFCGKKFTTGGHLYEHLRNHSNAKPYTCQICHRGFVASRHLEKHKRLHVNNRLYKCGICSESFGRQIALSKHLQEQHSLDSEIKTELPCDVDNATVSNPKNFCQTCKKRVRSLTIHTQRFHDPSASLKKNDGALCTNCGKKFSSLSRFRLHMRIHTGETPYKCKYCDKRMTNRNHLVIHERTHTGERPYVCNVCGRSFAQTSVLKTHMRIHTGRPFSCEICEKRFCRNAELRLHMRQHTGEKPYQCDRCEQAFKQASHLTEHLKRHNDERPYKCTHCDKGFKQMSTLKSHVIIHTGEKPFKCSQCPYACRQRYSLTQHMRQHSEDAPNPDRPHLCTLCQKGYSTMAMLMSHNDLVHKI